MVHCELYADDEICDIFDPRCNHDMIDLCANDAICCVMMRCGMCGVNH